MFTPCEQIAEQMGNKFWKQGNNNKETTSSIKTKDVYYIYGKIFTTCFGPNGPVSGNTYIKICQE
jgi:hypothetical protein